MKAPKFRSAYDGLPNPPGLDFSGSPSMAKQSFKAECDINTIVRRFKETGSVSHLASREGTYGDFGEVGDYHASMLTVRRAQESFEALPAAVRDRFRNDPGEFLEFVQDPENAPEMVEMGLAAPAEPTGEQLGSEGPPATKGGKKRTSEPAGGGDDQNGGEADE